MKQINNGIALYQDGQFKSIDFSPWGGIEGFLAATSDGSNAGYLTQLRILVPWLQRAVWMTANAISTLPYKITDENGGEVDKAAAWGGVKYINTLIGRVAASLCGGAGYLIKQSTDRAIVSLQYVIPDSMSPEYDAGKTKVESFKRTYDGKSGTPIPVNKVIYFWLPDDTIELGPAQIHPLGNAALAAGLIAAMDSTLKTYGERGFIPPTLLSAKGMPGKPEVEKAEAWWNAFLRGWTKTVAKVINAEALEPKQLGAGMDELRGTYIQLTRQQIENIGASFGIPASLFMSNAANYATANADRRTWYESGVFVSIYNCVQDAFTAQLFSKMGREFAFDINSIDAFQEDEVDKSGAYATYVNTQMKPSIAAQLVGLDMPAGMNYEDLDPEEEPEEPETPEETPQEDQPDQIDGIPDEDIDMDERLTEDERNAAEAMRKWEGYAVKKFDKRCDFEHKAIPALVAFRVRSALRSAKSVDEIPLIFESISQELPAHTLARAIGRMQKEG